MWTGQTHWACLCSQPYIQWLFHCNTHSIKPLRTDPEAPILWAPDEKSWLIGKDFDAGKDWGQEGKGVTKDEMIGWDHWLKGHEIEQTLGVSDGQGSLVCCSPWGHKELDMTGWLNNNNLRIIFISYDIYYFRMGPQQPCMLANSNSMLKFTYDLNTILFFYFIFILFYLVYFILRHNFKFSREISEMFLRRNWNKYVEWGGGKHVHSLSLKMGKISFREKKGIYFLSDLHYLKLEFYFVFIFNWLICSRNREFNIEWELLEGRGHVLFIISVYNLSGK